MSASARDRRTWPPGKRPTPRVAGITVHRHLPQAFATDNAKQMALEDTVRYFVPAAEFESLFAPKNHILLGSRGSGKTTWVRMLAHDHVSLAAKDLSARTDYARDALARNLIGIYVPASAAFTGDLRNKPWQSESESEQYFVWRLNLQSCSALTHIIDSCMDQYIALGAIRAQIQTDICRALSKVWTDGNESYTTFDGLRLALSNLEEASQAALRRARTSAAPMPAPTDHFHADLFFPLRHAIRVMRVHLPIPVSAVWMLCLDEVEYLTESHHRILNTQLRSASGDLVFKIATMPFAHHTLATNLADPVREGHDFEYVYVDREPIDSRGNQGEGDFLRFARRIFTQRMKSRADGLSKLTLGALLGPSPLLDDKHWDTPNETEAFMSLLRKHANAATVARAERLRTSPKFGSEIVRKLHGALLLREAVTGAHGNTKVRIYAGESLVVRCCDGNARRLMRVINSLIQRLEFDKEGRVILPIDPAVQNDVLETLGRETLTRTQSEPPHGELTARYLDSIGRFMRWLFLSSTRRLGTDQTSSVTIVEQDGPDAQRFIKQAIQLSLMIPAKSVPVKTPDYTCVGEFHLSFLFAPHYRLLPRRNRSARLSRVLAHASGHAPATSEMQHSLLDAE